MGTRRWRIAGHPQRSRFIIVNVNIAVIIIMLDKRLRIFVLNNIKSIWVDESRCTVLAVADTKQTEVFQMTISIKRCKSCENESLNVSALVTCEIKLFQNCFSFHRSD